MTAPDRPPGVWAPPLLANDEAYAVRALARAVADEDGVAALSEGFDLALETPGGHVLVRRDALVVGYAGIAPDASAEVLVHPAHRRRGLGRSLAQTAISLGAQRFWSHGDQVPAQALARRLGLERVRELHRMDRPLTASDRAAPTLPHGFIVETFAQRPDVEALQRLNAAAFAHHPEQGALTVDDLRRRMHKSWFDPHGLFWLIDSNADRDADPAGFHWTKVEAPHPGASTDTGETYVVSVHPAYQGRGLARPLTRVGIAHLAERGLATVTLYVDGDNAAALATYAKEGFRVAATDVMYAVPPRVSG